MKTTICQVEVSDLKVTYLENGMSDGWPLLLSHGFPYDVHDFDNLAPILVDQGARVIRPYLRGYGPTSFRSPSTMLSGQQAALGLLGGGFEPELVVPVVSIYMQGHWKMALVS